MITRHRILAATIGTISLVALGAYAFGQEGHMSGRMGMGHGMMSGMNQGMNHGMGDDMGRRMGRGMDHGARQDHQHTGPGRGVGSGMGPDPRRGMGPGTGMGMGMMGGGDATMLERQELHSMFLNHDRITRTVANLPNGIRTVTESDDPELAKTILSHVAGMMKRVEESRDPRLAIQSPTLETIFRNKDKIETTFDSTPKGIVVTQTSNDAETVAALQKHASEVTDLVKRGMVAAHETMIRNTGSRTAGHDHR